MRRVITDTDIWRTVDYYEATNHIPPYANATYYPGGAGGTAANYFLQRADYAQFHPDRARFRGCT